MSNAIDQLPATYSRAIRVLLKYAVAMAVFGLLSGVLFQESSKKLDYTEVDPGLHIEATLHLALVHGHVFLTAVLIPIAMAGALLLARRAGGRESPSRSIRWLTQGYLPFVTATILLMLYKGYFILLQVRGGEQDLAIVNDRFFGGQTLLRHSIYGLVHTGMAVCLVVFLVALWRSLKPRA